MVTHQAFQMLYFSMLSLKDFLKLDSVQRFSEDKFTLKKMINKTSAGLYVTHLQYMLFLL